ncbi:2'-5' RNA ligase [Clostridium neuense]|uniref:2'-5' RNA ligase n=1 Tax=Clostridium neuense TaxID=1728934 RepID=A0ABW8TEY5_9CLOT
MKYCLIAEFTKESYSNIENVQRYACKKYKLYKKLQNLHIMLETMDEPNLDKLDKIMLEQIKPYKKFKIKIEPNLVYDNEQKAVALKVEQQGYIIRIIRNLCEKLNYSGFKLHYKNLDDLYNLYIPIANGNYQLKNLFQQANQNVNNILEKSAGTSFFKIQGFKLCKLTGYKKISVIKSYPLKDY